MPTPTLGTAVFANSGTGATDTLSATVTVASGEGLYVGIGIRNLGAATISSVVWDPGGAAEALSLSSEAVADTDQTTHVYKHRTPTAGTKSVTVTLSTTKRFTMFGVPVAGLKTSSYEGSTTSTNGTSLTASLSVTATVGDLVIDVVSKRRDDGGGSETITSNGTEAGQTATNNATADNNCRLGLAQRTADATTEVCSWTWSGTNRDWAIVGIALVGEAAAATGHGRLLGGTRNRLVY